MKNILTLACAAALIASPIAMAAGLTAEQIADRNATARGGLATWRAVGSMKLSGQMDAGGTPAVRLPFEMSLKRPHKSRLELHVTDQTAVQVYDGQQGWKVRPYLNRDDVEAYSPQEAQSAADDADLDGPLIDHARKGTRIELAGTDTVEGRKAYRLRLTRADGLQANLWIDTTTFLDVKIDGEPRRLDNKVHKVAVFYRDFKTVDGLKIPMTLETVVEGVRQTRKISFQAVTVNPPLAEALFDKPQPAAVKQASAR
jgi:outer membrane lipoprotein-sorting protein